jgi:hypothetical protein
MDDLQTAKQRLEQHHRSLVFVKDSEVLFETSMDGLAGFLKAIDELGFQLSGSAAADKIMGKAAALLSVHSRVEAVYAATMSRKGLEVLRAHSIRAKFGHLADRILNAQRSGCCPFEELVADTSDHEEAFRRIKQTQKAKAEVQKSS